MVVLYIEKSMVWAAGRIVQIHEKAAHKHDCCQKF